MHQGKWPAHLEFSNEGPWIRYSYSLFLVELPSFISKIQFIGRKRKFLIEYEMQIGFSLQNTFIHAILSSQALNA